MKKYFTPTSNKACLADGGWVAQILDDVAYFISVVCVSDLHVWVEFFVDCIEGLDKHRVAQWLNLHVRCAQKVLDASISVVFEVLVTDDPRIFHLLDTVWNNVHPGAVAP